MTLPSMFPPIGDRILWLISTNIQQRTRVDMHIVGYVSFLRSTVSNILDHKHSNLLAIIILGRRRTYPSITSLGKQDNSCIGLCLCYTIALHFIEFLDILPISFHQQATNNHSYKYLFNVRLSNQNNISPMVKCHYIALAEMSITY